MKQKNNIYRIKAVPVSEEEFIEDEALIDGKIELIDILIHGEREVSFAELIEKFNEQFEKEGLKAQDVVKRPPKYDAMYDTDEGEFELTAIKKAMIIHG